MGKSKNKKEPTDLEKVNAVLQEDLDDKEIQERYDGFVRERDRLESDWNGLEEKYQEFEKKEERLKFIILQSALDGVLGKKSVAVSELRKMLKEKKELSKIMDEIKGKIDYQNFLIERYDLLSDKKFFTYWKVLKALDSATPEWLEWKEQYEGVRI